MSRVIFILHSLRSGGCERQATLLAKELHSLGHECTVLACHNGGVYQSELESSGVHVAYLQRRFKGDLIGLVSSLRKELRALKPDAVYSFLQVPNVISALSRSAYRPARFAWGLRSSNQDLRPYGRVFQLVDWIERKLSNSPDVIIANSQAGSNYAVKRGFPASKMVVIPNGIDTNRFQPRPEERSRLRKAWNIADDDLVVGMVARLDPVKDHTSFVQAAAIVVKQFPNVRFVCAGGGPPNYAGQLRSLAQSAGLGDQIIWLGNVVDPIGVYSAFDIATLTSSTGEGFPNAVGEAMACGVCCVVTDVGDCSRIVGDTGMITPPSNPERLASAWISTLNSAPAVRGSLARDRIMSEFAIEKATSATVDALRI